MKRARSLASITLLALASISAGCRARPQRFSSMSVVPAPKPTPPATFVIAPQAESAQSIAESIFASYGSAFQYNKRAGLFCDTAAQSDCKTQQLLNLSAFVEPAPPASPATKNSMFLRSAERAQAELVRRFFELQPKDAKADAVLKSLFDQINDQKEPAPADSLASPRFQLTWSHQLMLPGEWERVQYLALHLILHSRDVKFVDTNEFESILRDIDLGKLVQTAANKLSGEASTAFGDTTVSSTTVNRPGNAKLGFELSYTEQLDRALKEQLQFRASSIDSTQRIFSVVLKSSQTNKLPTLARQTITLRYDKVLHGNEGVLSASFKNGAFTALKLSDLPIRERKHGMAAGDSATSGYDIVEATPLYVAVVRRVANAKGVRTSLEDDDDVEYVTQAGFLPPVRLHQTSKCLYQVNVNTMEDRDALVYVEPAVKSGTPAVRLDDYSQAMQFVAALRARFDAADAASRSNGLAFGDKDPAALQGFRFGFKPKSASAQDPVLFDWNLIKIDTLKSTAVCY